MSTGASLSIKIVEDKGGVKVEDRKDDNKGSLRAVKEDTVSNSETFVILRATEKNYLLLQHIIEAYRKNREKSTRRSREIHGMQRTNEVQNKDVQLDLIGKIVFNHFIPSPSLADRLGTMINI